MALPTISLNPTSGPAGTTVTVTVVRDVVLAAPIPVTVTATTAGGVGSATFTITPVPEALTLAAGGRTITKVSDDGTTYVGTFVA